MTEEEARTKWCPFARVAINDDGAGNRWPGKGMEAWHDDEGDPSPLCIASACMAWRWSEEKRTAAFLQAVVEHMKATGDNFNKATQEVVKRRAEFAHTEGFCGLAGAPQ